MDISNSLQDLLVTQIGKEMESACRYLGMAAYCEETDWTGSAKWLKNQWREELSHVSLIFNKLNELGVKVKLPCIKHSLPKMNSLLDVFEEAYVTEKDTSAALKNIYETASANKDSQVLSFLDSMLQEQIKEEETLRYIINLLKKTKGSTSALIMVDHTIERLLLQEEN